MAVAVLREVVAGHEVPAARVVHVAVAVVVDARRAVDFGGVARELAGEVDVVGVDAGVDDGDGHAGALALLPGGERVDVGADVAGLAGVGLPGVLETPEGRPVEVVRLAQQVYRLVGLGVDDVAVGAQRGERCGGGLTRRGLDELGALERQRGDELHAGVLAQFAALSAVEPGLALRR